MGIVCVVLDNTHKKPLPCLYRIYLQIFLLSKENINLLIKERERGNENLNNFIRSYFPKLVLLIANARNVTISSKGVKAEKMSHSSFKHLLYLVDA